MTDERERIPARRWISDRELEDDMRWIESIENWYIFILKHCQCFCNWWKIFWNCMFTNFFRSLNKKWKQSIVNNQLSYFGWYHNFFKPIFIQFISTSIISIHKKHLKRILFFFIYVQGKKLEKRQIPMII